MRCVRKPERRFLALLLCASLLAVGSCAEDGEADSGPVNEFAGILETVYSSEVLLDGELAAGGNRIPFGAILVTDESGVAAFRLAGRLACRLQQSGEIRVGRSVDAPPVFVIGTLRCSSDVTGDTRPRLEAAGKIVEVGQARVKVEVTEEGAEVNNFQGEVIIIDNVPLDPGKQITIDRETGEVGTPRQIPAGTFSSEATEVFEALEESLLRSNPAETETQTEELTDDTTDDEETETQTEDSTDDTTDDEETETQTEDSTDDTTDDEETSEPGDEHSDPLGPD